MRRTVRAGLLLAFVLGACARGDGEEVLPDVESLYTVSDDAVTCAGGSARAVGPDEVVCSWDDVMYAGALCSTYAVTFERDEAGAWRIARRRCTLLCLRPEDCL